MLDAVLDETSGFPQVDRRFYKWQNDPYMPVEFSVAAYRFGHSMIRGRYKLNTLVGPLPTFTSDSVSLQPLGHFGGFRILPPFWTIEWARFFEVDGAGKDDRQQSRLIDTKLANVLDRAAARDRRQPAVADRPQPHPRGPPAAAVGPGRGRAHGHGGPHRR